MQHMASRAFIATLCLTALPAAVCAAQADADEPNVTARLLADTTAVAPGESLLLGVHLTMADGWHVYWKNPGEAGLPTRVRWTLPDGFRAGHLKWPVPERFTMPGRITAFGYAGEVMLLAWITVPDDLGDRKQVTFKAKVSWLACNDTCVPGEAQVQVTLPVGRRPDTPQSDRLVEWWRRAPKRLPSHDATFTITRPDGKTMDYKYIRLHLTDFGPANDGVRETLEGPYAVRLRWNNPVSDVEWFPVPGKALDVGKATVRHKGRCTDIRFTARVLPGQQPDDPIMEGVVAYANAKGKRRGLRVDVPLMALKEKEPEPAPP